MSHGVDSSSRLGPPLGTGCLGGSMIGAELKYAAVTPARDEAPNLRRLAACLVAQSIPATAWVIVDDGSRPTPPRRSLRSPLAVCPTCACCGAPIAAAGKSGPASLTPSAPAWRRCAWTTSTICASWTWIWTCRSATGKSQKRAEK